MKILKKILLSPITYAGIAILIGGVLIYEMIGYNKVENKYFELQSQNIKISSEIQDKDEQIKLLETQKTIAITSAILIDTILGDLDDIIRDYDTIIVNNCKMESGNWYERENILRRYEDLSEEYQDFVE